MAEVELVGTIGYPDTKHSLAAKIIPVIISTYNMGLLIDRASFLIIRTFFYKLTYGCVTTNNKHTGKCDDQNHAIVTKHGLWIVIVAALLHSLIVTIKIAMHIAALFFRSNNQSRVLLE